LRQITLETTDVFIECTATDLTKAKIVLNTVCTMFAEYCAAPFEVEPVEVLDAFGKSHGASEGVQIHASGMETGCRPRPARVCTLLFCSLTVRRMFLKR
jgi:phenylalanyl-tRNA synthetase beta subunit